MHWFVCLWGGNPEKLPPYSVLSEKNRKENRFYLFKKKEALYNILCINIKHLWTKYGIWTVEYKSGYCFFIKQLELRLKRYLRRKWNLCFKTEKSDFFSVFKLCRRIRLFVFWSCCCLRWMVLDGLRADGCTLFLSEEIPVEPSKTSCGDPSIPAWEFHGLRLWQGLQGVQVWALNHIKSQSKRPQTGLFPPLVCGDDDDWGSVADRSQISECSGFIVIKEEEPLFHFPSPPYLIRTWPVAHSNHSAHLWPLFKMVCVRKENMYGGHLRLQPWPHGLYPRGSIYAVENEMWMNE